jgi:hypothetical protein
MVEKCSVLCLNRWMSCESKIIKCLGDSNRSSHPTLKARRMTLSDVVQTGDHDIVFSVGMASAVLWASRP